LISAICTEAVGDIFGVEVLIGATKGPTGTGVPDVMLGVEVLIGAIGIGAAGDISGVDVFTGPTGIGGGVNSAVDVLFGFMYW